MATRHPSIAPKAAKAAKAKRIAKARSGEKGPVVETPLSKSLADRMDIFGGPTS